MNRRLGFLGLLPLFLVVVGCGGASHSSSPPSVSAGTSSTAPSTKTTASTTTAGSSAQPTTTAASSGGAAAPRAGKPKRRSQATPEHKPNPAGGSINVRVPATFAIRSGGRLEPQTVSAPAFLAVQVTMRAGDGRGHQVVIRTPTPHTLTVPAGGRGSILIAGQRAGQYRIDVDGSTRGALLIGGEPGP